MVKDSGQTKGSTYIKSAEVAKARCLNIFKIRIKCNEISDKLA